MKAQALSALHSSAGTSSSAKNVDATANTGKKSSLLLKVLSDSANRHAKRDTIKVIDAGGGPGHENLKFSELQERQKSMYKRTLDDPPILQDNRFQETRQLKIYEQPIIITVNVAREDFPSISADFTCSYVISAPQSGWARFLSDVKTNLKLEFIECIVDRMDGAPVFRMLTLRNGGNYFVRQRESSSILEILSTNQAPQTYIWPVTKDIAIVQEDLAYDVKTFPKTDAKIDSLILRPLVRPQERDAALALLSSTTVDDIICIMDEVMHSVVVEEEKKESEDHDKNGNAERDDDYSDNEDGDKDDTKSNPDTQKEEKKPVEIKKTYDKNVDIVNLHRIALESFSRFVLQGPKRALQVIEEGLQFVFDTLKVFNNEVDLIVMGFRLIAELAPWLGPKKKEVIVCLLDCIQFYSPPSPVHRPRQIPRNNIKPIKSNLLKLLGMDEEDEGAGVDGAKKLTLAERMAKKLGLDKLVNDEPEPEPEPELEPEPEITIKVRRADANRPLKAIKMMSLSKGFVGKLRPPRTKEEIEEERQAKMKEEEYLRRQRELMDPTTEAERLARKAALREKFAKLPPVAAPPAFRCFSKNNYPNAYALTQSYVTFFKLMTQHAIFRVQAFELYAHEEICYIALECGSLPRVLEYTVWIINEIYRDGIQLNDDDDVESMDATMAASSLRSREDGDADLDNLTIRSDRDAQSIDPCTGFIIEAVSTITTPSLDSQLGFNELTPRVNIGDPNEKMKKDKNMLDPKELKNRYRKGDAKSNTTGKDINESVYYDPDEKVESDSDSENNNAKRRVGEASDENGVVENGVVHDDVVEPIVPDDDDAVQYVDDGAEENVDHDVEDIDENDKKDVEKNKKIPVPERAPAPVRTNRGALLMASSPVTNKSPKMDTKHDDQGEDEEEEESSEDALRQQKYRAIPADVVVIALAMISTHVDLASDSKEMAMKWLGVWDDASAHYRALRTKGNNISGM